MPISPRRAHVIDVAIERETPLYWAHQPGVAPITHTFADHLNLFVSYVALDVVIFRVHCEMMGATGRLSRESHRILPD